MFDLGLEVLFLILYLLLKFNKTLALALHLSHRLLEILLHRAEAFKVLALELSLGVNVLFACFCREFDDFEEFVERLAFQIG